MDNVNTDEMNEVDFGMSNFDHEIDEGMEDALKCDPGKVFGPHAGWNFHGRVFYYDGQFCEEVWVYGSPREIIKADTLQELMDAVSDKYGWD